MSQHGGKMDEMDDEFGVVDLDAVDDDRDVDTDAATATTPDELRRRIDRYVQLPPRSPRRAVSVPASVAPVARGAAVGAGVAAGAGVARRHPKLTLGAAILAAILAVTPAEKRPAMIKRMAKIAAVLVGLAALLIGVVLLIGVNTPNPGVSPAPPPTSAAPTSTSSCLWGPALCSNGETR